MPAYRIRYFTTVDGRIPLAEWQRSITDGSARVAIVRRIARMELGNFGDHRFCREGVWELRIDLGPGYRVYYALVGRTVVLLLVGGTKRTQGKNIAKACSYLRQWQSEGPLA